MNDPRALDRLARALSMLVLLSLVCGVSCGPAAGGAGVGSAAAGSPDEVRRQLVRRQDVKLHQRQFFVGLAAGDSLDLATQQAYSEIKQQLTWLPAESRHLMEGMIRVDKSVTDNQGRVHVLAVLERQAAATYLQKLAEEQRATLAATLNGCERHLQAGETARARVCANQASAQTEQVRTLFAAAKAAIGDEARATPFAEEDRLRALEGRVKANEVRGRAVLVHVLRYEDGALVGDLNAVFRKAVSDKGLTVAAGEVPPALVTASLEGSTESLAQATRVKQAGFAIVGKVEAHFSSADSGQYFAWAKGRLRIIETTSARTVADLAYDKVKGGHVSRAQAVDKAVDNAVEKLLSELQGKLTQL